MPSAKTISAEGTAQPPGSGTNGQEDTPLSVPLPALRIDGLTISKGALLEALRLYVPRLADISQLDAERFLLHLETHEEEPRS